MTDTEINDLGAFWAANPNFADLSTELDLVELADLKSREYIEDLQGQIASFGAQQA